MNEVYASHLSIEGNSVWLTFGADAPWPWWMLLAALTNFAAQVFKINKLASESGPMD